MESAQCIKRSISVHKTHLQWPLQVVQPTPPDFGLGAFALHIFFEHRGSAEHGSDSDLKEHKNKNEKPNRPNDTHLSVPKMGGVDSRSGSPNTDHCLKQTHRSTMSIEIDAKETSNGILFSMW